MDAVSILVENLGSQPKWLFFFRSFFSNVKDFLMSNGIAVITGDLYRSSTGYERGLPYVKSMEAMLKQISDDTKFLVKNVDVFRGDFFQITLYEPTTIFELSVYIRSFLISLSENKEVKYDARLSLSYSETNASVGPDSKSYFEDAYIISGRRLDFMEKDVMMEFNSSMDNWHHSFYGVIRLLDFMVGTLSKPQAEVLSWAIRNKSLYVPEIALATKKTQQNIHKLISRSGIKNIMDFLEFSKEQIHSLR